MLIKRHSTVKRRWRSDGKCGWRNLLEDGTAAAECDPDGASPCCEGFTGICGNTSRECNCSPLCTDYRIIDKDWKESGGNLKWRYDGRCGTMNLLPDGSPAECNPQGEKPCCNNHGFCEGEASDCLCSDCVDYRIVRELRRSGTNCTVASLASRFLKNVCFNETTKLHYFKCTHSDVYYQPDYNELNLQTVTEVCKNDTFVYQACGFNTRISDTKVFCGGYICDRKIRDGHRYVPCSGNNCREDSRGCTMNSETRDPTICDGKCDSKIGFCRDESECNGYVYGVSCYRGSWPRKIPVYMVCNGQTSCEDESDEKDCMITDANTINSCIHYYDEVRTERITEVPILNYTRCSVFDVNNGVYPYCANYLDQTNCSDIERVGGYCKVNGFNSSVSKFMVCYEYDPIAELPISICDDNSQNQCLMFSSTNCRIHKHRVCDGINDCVDGIDEISEDCKIMTYPLNFTCVRRFNLNNRNTEIPISWIMDNVTDCLDGEDENNTKWQNLFCKGEFRRFLLPGEKCQDVYRCPGKDRHYVSFENLCDGVESCGNGGENDVCNTAKDMPLFNRTASYNGSIRNVCISSTPTCELRNFLGGKNNVFGLMPAEILVPASKISCKNLFGEYYLFISCMDLCLETDVVCSIREMDSLKYDSCPGLAPNRTYTISVGEKSILTFMERSENGLYHQEFFKCKNSKCVEYKQVCDLVDDCGDMSDEINCVNHMICKETLNSSNQQFISLSQKCDGIYDCFDLSDECNDECGKQILGGRMLKVSCWFMGILAMLLNGFIMIKEFITLADCETEQLMISKVLMSIIGMGDFLIGLYLIVLSVYDSIIFGKEFCQHQADWLTGTPCLMLGVLSTLGSQISVFTMTVLSLIRMYGLTCRPMEMPEPINSSSISRVFILVVAIIVAAFSIAVTPLVPFFEDFFVLGMFYDPAYKVFVGFPNKERHVKILQKYYEHKTTGYAANVSDTMSWRDISERINSMFSQDYGKLTRRPVHFYGNDGVCLFKYFVRTDDARRSRQSLVAETKVSDPVVWTMLALNFSCFIIITCSYAMLTYGTKKSAKKSGQNENPDRVKSERAIQKKITVIIATDFLCWVPFIFISSLHNLDYIDASSWYVTLAMTVLPLNSVVNPLVYEKVLGELISRKLGDMRATLRRGISSVLEKMLTLLRTNSEQQDCRKENQAN